MAVGDAHVFPGFLTPVLTQLFFPKPPTTFLTCFCRGERRKYAGKKSRLNRGSNSQPPGLESDTLTTELPGRGTHCREIAVENIVRKGEIACFKQFFLFSQCFLYYMTLIVHFKCILKYLLCFFIPSVLPSLSLNSLFSWYVFNDNFTCFSHAFL